MGLLRLIGGNSVVFGLVFGADGVTGAPLLDAVTSALREPRPVTEDELASAKANSEAEFLRRTASLLGRADAYSRGACLFDDPGREESAAEALQGVTREAVDDAVRRWLAPSAAAVVAYDPTTDSPEEA